MIIKKFISVLLQSPLTFTPISNNLGAIKWDGCLFQRTGVEGLSRLKWAKTGVGRVKRGEYGSALSQYLYPWCLTWKPVSSLKRCLSFRNNEAKGIERLNSLMKSLVNWRLKSYEDEPSFLSGCYSDIKIYDMKMRNQKSIGVGNPSNCMHSQNFSVRCFIFSSSKSPSYV